MNKAELIERVSEMTNITKKDSQMAVNALFDAIQQALQSGEKVQIVGFGSFEVRDRAARSGRNPQTGEPMHIAARRVPVFKAGKSLRDAVMSH